MVLEVPCGSRSIKEGLEGSMMVWILPDPTRPFCTLLDSTGPFQTSGTSWNLVDPLDFPGPFWTHSEPSGPSLTLPDPSGPSWIPLDPPGTLDPPGPYWTLPDLSGPSWNSRPSWTLQNLPGPSWTLIDPP